MLVWDNLNTHVSATMTELIAARDWLTVYRLPPYAHELNPVEQVWSHLKRSLANLAKRNPAQLTVLVKTRLKRMQYRPGSSKASSPAPGLTSARSVTPPLSIGLVSSWVSTCDEFRPPTTPMLWPTEMSVRTTERSQP